MRNLYLALVAVVGAAPLTWAAEPPTATSPASTANPAPTASPAPAAGPAPAPRACLATDDGYLRAHIRGSMTLDINLRNAELECEGGPRPNGSGIRVSFAGPVRSDGRRLRMVFGIASATEGAAGRELPTNLTVIFEGEQRLFATLGDDKCTVDELRQERVGELGSPVRAYRVIARGFCIAPARALDKDQTILVNSFDFAGRVTFEDSNTAQP